MVPLGFGLLALGLLVPLIIAPMGETGIVVDLFVSVIVLIWIGSQGNTWLRSSVLKRGFKLVSASAQTN